MGDVFLYDGARDGVLRFVACNRGGKLTSDRHRSREYLEDGLREFLQRFPAPAEGDGR